MEGNLKQNIMQPKTFKSKNNNIFVNGRRPQFILKIEDDLKNIMQPQTNKSKNNECGTAPVNLAFVKNGR